MIKLENDYTTLERMIKPTRYERDTCPWVGVVTMISPFPSPPYCHYAEVFVTRPMMYMTY
jgi:hypothetical protein